MKIKFANVNKNYGSICALKDINFEIESGDFVFIIGHSGAGKSTILKLILNQIKPSTGEIYVGDTDIVNGSKKEIEDVRKKIGVIFQDYQLIADKSIEENIMLGLDIIGYPKNEISQKVDEVIKKVNLNHRRFLFPAQLSGGELQRAALARALAIDPKIILADEPTGNLDTENAWNLMKLLKDINENNKTTIIMTTHNTDIVDSFNKPVIKIDNGEMMIASNPETKTQEVKKTHKKHIHSKKS